MSLTVITVPAEAEPKGVVVALHGWGANAQDVAFLTSMLRLKQYQFLLPNAPFPHPYGGGGYMWYGFPERFDFQQDLSDRPDLLTSRQRLTEWLESLPDTTGVPLSRTILGGFSQGGAMTLDVGLHLPLAGLMVLSGYSHGPLERSTTPTPPILMVHGRQDAVVPLIAAHKTRDHLLALEATVQYEEFDMGHEIALPVLDRLQAFVQKTLR